MLPMILDRTADADWELVNTLLSGRWPGSDSARLRQILQDMKRHLLAELRPFPRVILDFWTPSEVQSLLDTFKNFGASFLEQSPSEVLAMTGLLSKNLSQVLALAHELVAVMQRRESNSSESVVIAENFAHLREAPPGCRDELVIPSSEMNIVVKRVVLDAVREGSTKQISFTVTKPPRIAFVCNWT
jgi:hypothetical protein